MALALIGYGEVGRIFAAALAKGGHGPVRAYDVREADPAWMAEARGRAAADGVTLAASAAEAVETAQLVLSAVTAANTLAAAESAVGAMARDAFYVDVNSASPRTKQAAAERINGAGARYLEVAIMTSVPPQGLRVPMLLGGPHAEASLPVLGRLGFSATVGSPRYGVVSALKLCRSVMIKGMEALVIESFLTARHYGVEAQVLASLTETFPGMDWEKQGSYFWQRVVQHGARRAEEMREAAVTVSDAGLTTGMAATAAGVQSWMAALKAEGVFQGAAKDAGWRELADRVEAKSPPAAA